MVGPCVQLHHVVPICTSIIFYNLLSKFGEISFQEYVTEKIFHQVFYGDLVYKLRRVKCEANLSRRALK